MLTTELDIIIGGGVGEAVLGNDAAPTATSTFCTGGAA